MNDMRAQHTGHSPPASASGARHDAHSGGSTPSSVTLRALPPNCARRAKTDPWLFWLVEGTACDMPHGSTTPAIIQCGSL